MTTMKERLAAMRANAEAEAKLLLADEAILPEAVRLLSGHDASQPSSLPPALDGALRAFIDDSTLDDVVHPEPIWVIVAEALAQLTVVAGEPDGSWVGKQRKRLGEAPSWVYDSWLDACVRVLRALEPDKISAWVDELGRAPPIGDAAAGACGPVAVFRSSGSWAVADSLQLWTEEPIAFHSIAEWTALNLLHRLDPMLWFRAIDSWADPRLVHSALFPAGARETPAEFLEFLRAARPCFTQDGAATDACAAVVLWQAALRLAQELMNAHDGDAGKAAAREHVRRVVEVVLQRSDGPTLALAAAARTVDETLLTDNSHRVPSLVPVVTWEVLSAALTEAGIAVSNQRELFNERRAHLSGQRGGAVRRTLPALLVAFQTLGVRRGADSAALLQWLQSALSESSEWTQKHTINFWLQQVVDMLSLAENPVATTTEFFLQLESVRRRSEYARTYQEQDGELTSLLLLVVLATLVLRKLSTDPEKDLTFVRDRALRIALTNSSTTEPVLSAREVVAIAIQVVTDMFGLDDERTATLLWPVVWDREVLGEVLTRLAKESNTADIEKLLSRLGRQPDDVRLTAEAWAAATGHPRDAHIAKVTIEALPPSS